MATDQRRVTKNSYKKTGRQEAKEDAAIELSSLSYLYPNNATQVLNSVSFKFAPGEVVAIVGASGSGKSTMLKLVAGLLQPTKGKVITEKGRRVGLAPQSPTLLPWLSVIENITLKERLGQRRKVSKEEAKRLLDRFGIGDKTDSKPSELSGGMQSRAALARALAGSPDVYYLMSHLAHLTK